MPRPHGWDSPGAFADAARIAASAFVPRIVLRIVPRIVQLAVLLIALVPGCRRVDGPPDDSPVRSVVVTIAQSQILVGGTTQAAAKLLDAGGQEVLDRVPFWRSATPSIVRVSQTGEVTGLQAGTGEVRAVSGNISAGATIQVRNAVAATIQLAQGAASVQLPGGTFQAIAAVTDEVGRPMANPPITWTSLQPLVATVNVAGLVTGIASGNATVTASIDGISASLAVQVRPATVTGGPTITDVMPQPLRPGATFTLSGTGFAATTGGNQVLVDGVAASVVTATPTQLNVALPLAGFACEPSRDAVVQLSVGGLLAARVTPLQAGTRRALAVGEAAIVADADEVRCNELVPATGRWVVSIYNATRAQVTPSATGNAQFQVRGIPGLAALGTIAHASVPATVGAPATASSPTTVVAQAPIVRATPSPHLDLLERSIGALRVRAPRIGAASISAGPRGAPRSEFTTLNSVTSVKIPNLDAADLCVSNLPIQARTVFVGSHAVILEDTAGVFNGRTTLRGQMDDYYLRLGSEFEQVIWPIISGAFGNPLAMDGQVNNIGRIVMVFSPRVNGMRAGAITGFVASCDFFPASQRPSSNGGAFFYAAVPTSGALGYAVPDTRDHWMRLVRSTVIHEVKHLTSFAERLSRSLPAEDLSWEEGSARIAEEMFARAVYPVAPLANITYASTIGCDLRYELGVAPCADRPLLMLRHFGALYSYLMAPEIVSPLGRATANDVNFYAGAWSVLRWASEHAAATEDAFFRDFTASTNAGVANIEARTGRHWEDLLGEWSLAAYLDDLPGFVPENSRLRFRSWDHADIWRGLCSDLGPCASSANPAQLYPRATPFTPRQRSFGSFQFEIASMIGGGVSYLDLEGPGFASQTIEIKAALGSGDAPSTVRVAFVRVR